MYCVDFILGEENEIFRGLWFYDGYEPYEYGEEVEIEHLNMFNGDGIKNDANEDNGKSGIYLTSLNLIQHFEFITLPLYFVSLNVDSFKRYIYWRHACSMVFAFRSVFLQTEDFY